MFNKYLIVARHDTDIRNNEEVATLLRNADLRRSVVRSEGVYDVLDHATATTGIGGKLALDLTITDIDSSSSQCSNIDISISGFKVKTELVEKWSTLLIFAEPEQDVTSIKTEIDGVNFVAIFDLAAIEMNPYELLWLATANTEPKRDVEQIDNAKASLIIDARSKRPGRAGNPKRFPNVVHSLPEVIDLVDRRWSDYNIGEFIESPSKRYGKLLLSNREDW